jgi:hypothetical protein
MADQVCVEHGQRLGAIEQLVTKMAEGQGRAEERHGQVLEKLADIQKGVEDVTFRVSEHAKLLEPLVVIHKKQAAQKQKIKKIAWSAVSAATVGILGWAGVLIRDNAAAIALLIAPK